MATQQLPAWEVRSADFEKSATRRAHFPHNDLPHVAFVGRSNVGKSSLLNVLCNRKRLAMVSRTPGRTQLINFFRINGDELYFVDLPGYGFAQAPKAVKAGWDKMITNYLQNNPHLKLVVALFDARRKLSEEDLQLVEWLRHFRIPFLAVITKADKLSRMQQTSALRDLAAALRNHSPVAVELFSALSRAGREQVLAVIGSHVHV